MMPTLRKPAEVKRRSRPARVGALASLPLFFPLEGRKVLLAGGTEAAAWKAELLAAAGADVHVHAQELEPAFEALLVAGSIKGRFIHHRSCWSQQDFEGAALAIADAESDEEAEAFVLAARRSGVPVNVIDNPAYCDFQFGSIVNRSPVVIGISTNGVAPILGQAIRRRIETLMPESLQGWAQLASRLREKTLSLLDAGHSGADSGSGSPILLFRASRRLKRKTISPKHFWRMQGHLPQAKSPLWGQGRAMPNT